MEQNISNSHAPEERGPWEYYQNNNMQEEERGPWEYYQNLENRLFSPRKDNWGNLRRAFAGDPLAFIDDRQTRIDLDFATGKAENPELERKKWALAAYFSQMRKEDILFCHGNLDTLIEHFNGGKQISAEEAYDDIAKAIPRPPEKNPKPPWHERFALAFGTLQPGIGTLSLPVGPESTPEKAKEAAARAGEYGESAARHLYAGIGDVSKGIVSTAAAAARAAEGAEALVSTVNWPLEMAAELAGWDGLADFFRNENYFRQDAANDNTRFLSGIRRSLEEYSREIQREVDDQIQRSPVQGETLEGKIALGVIRNLPNTLFAVSLAAAQTGAAANGLDFASGTNWASGWFGLSSTANELAETYDDPGMSDTGRFYNAVVVGFAEAFFEEWTGIGGIWRRHFSKPVSRTAAKEGAASIVRSAARFARDLGMDMAGEGWEEAETGLVQRFSNLIYGKNGRELGSMSALDIARELFAPVPEEFGVGAVSGGIMHAGAVRSIAQNARALEFQARMIGAARRQAAMLESFDTPTQAQTEEAERLRDMADREDVDGIMRYAMEKQKMLASGETSATPEEKAEQAASGLRSDLLLPHDPHETSAAVERAKKEYPAAAVSTVTEWSDEQLSGQIDRFTAKYPELSRDDAAAFLRLHTPALWQDGKVIINTAVARPGDVPFLLAHEIGLHQGIRAAYGERAAKQLFDAVWQDCQNHPLMRQVIEDNALRHELTDDDGNPLTDEDGDPLFSELSVADQRLAAEEFLARLQETGGTPVDDIYEEHHAEIKEWAGKHGFDTADPDTRGELVRSWMRDTGFTPPRPNWLRRLIARIRVFFRRRGWFVSHLSDDDILSILSRSAQAGRRNGGDGARTTAEGETETRFALFDHEYKRGRIFKALRAIANGNEEATVTGLRNDLEQYGGTNDITFLWGNEKKGIYHIAYRRGIYTLFHVIDTVGDGRILRHVPGNKTVILEKDGYEAVLALTEYGNRKSWLLSGWKTNAPDAVGEVGTQSDATQLKPTFSRHELGAGLDAIISQIDGKSSAEDEKNGKFSGSRLAFDGFELDARLKKLVDVLRPHVGQFMEEDKEHYVKILREQYGIEITPQEAYVVVQEAVHRNGDEARRRSNDRRDTWIYETYPFYAAAVGMGGTGFRIKPSPKFADQTFTGSFISENLRSKKGQEVKTRRDFQSDRAWQNYLDRRKGKFAAADGIDSEALAAAVARENGGDPLQIEQEIIDFFRDLKKKELYAEYKKFKDDSVFESKEADRRAMEEFMAQEKYQLEEEAVELLTRGEGVVTPEWIKENRKLFNTLYEKIFPGKKAPYDPGKAEISAINGALIQQGHDAGTYAAAMLAARQQAYEEYMTKLRELRDRLNEDRLDVRTLQRDAIRAASHYPPEIRGAWIRGIVGLADYPAKNGKRQKEFEKLLRKMTEDANTHRQKLAVERIVKRLGEVGEKAREGRKVRGVRDPEIQRKLNRIIAISRMDGGALNMEITARQQEIEKRLADGENTAEQEYDIALLNRYGELWRKNADDVENALAHLNLLARQGKDELLEKIRERQAEDEQDRNELWKAVNGMKRLSSVDKKALRDNRERRWKAMKKLDAEFWSSLSLDGIFHSFAFFAGGGESIIDRFASMAHQSKTDKDAMNRRNADDVREKLKELLHVKTSIGVADRIGKWREIRTDSGVFRFVPDPDARQFEYEHIGIDRARRLLAKYDAGNGVLADYEAEAVRQQLRTFDYGIRYDEVPEEFRDGATEKLLKLIRQEENARNPEEPQIVIPRRTFKGTVSEIPLSQLQGLYLKLLWEQKDVRYKMHYNGYSEETMAQIDRFLSPEIKEFGKWMRGELEKDRRKIAEIYRKIYHATFPAEEMYFPSVYDVSRPNAGKSAVDIAEEGAGAGAHVYTPGALKVRVYHLKDVRVADALTVFQNHRLLMNHFVTHAETARKMRAVLLHPDIKSAIEAEHGGNCFREMQNALTDFINGGNADVAVNGIAAELYSNAVRAKMAFNSFSGGKQTSGLLTYILEIPAHKLAAGIAYALRHPKEVLRTLAGTDYFQNRLQSGANADLRLLLDAGGRSASQAAEIFEHIDRFGSLPLRYGDAAAALFGGFAVYKYHYDNLVKHGMPLADAHRKALERWQITTERTQQSGNPFFLNRHQRGEYTQRLFTTFLSNQILLWNHYAPAVYRAIHYKDQTAWKKAGCGAAALVLSSFAATAIDLLRRRDPDDEYQWPDLLWNLLADALCGSGPAGSIAAEAVNTLKPGGFASPKLYLGDVLYAGYSIKRQFFGKKAADWADHEWRDAVNILVALGYLWQPVAETAAVAKETRKWYQIFNGKQ